MGTATVFRVEGLLSEAGRMAERVSATSSLSVVTGLEVEGKLEVMASSGLRGRSSEDRSRLESSELESDEDGTPKWPCRLSFAF